MCIYRWLPNGVESENAQRLSLTRVFPLLGTETAITRLDFPTAITLVPSSLQEKGFASIFQRSAFRPQADCKLVGIDLLNNLIIALLSKKNSLELHIIVVTSGNRCYLHADTVGLVLWVQPSVSIQSCVSDNQRLRFICLLSFSSTAKIHLRLSFCWEGRLSRITCL